VPSVFPKGSSESKLWMNFNTSKYILESYFSIEYDIIILDRGLYDLMFWIDFDSTTDIKIAEENTPFAEILKKYPPDLLITLMIPPEESIKRRGGEGRLVTKEFVSRYNHILKDFINSLKINKTIIFTNNKSIPTVVNEALVNILEIIIESS